MTLFSRFLKDLKRTVEVGPQEMLDRARRCLRLSPPGSLFVIEKTSLCRGRDTALAREFQEALEAAGFQCQKYLGSCSKGRLVGMGKMFDGVRSTEYR